MAQDEPAAWRVGGAMIPVAKPFLGDEEVVAATRAIRSGWVTQGAEVAAFEHEFAEAVGAKFARAVSSCTTALHLALRALGVGAGDEVVTVSHSFIATANAVRHVGATPVFVDVDPRSFNIDPDEIERAVSSRTKAILCVHQIGMPCDLPAVVAVGKRHGIPTVEDAACAVGSEIRVGDRWEKIGAPHGDVACFSFHPRKILTTGEGGMLTTGRAELDEKFRLLRQHSMNVSDATRHAATQVVVPRYDALGFNYRMTDIQAAIGREQLKKLPQIVARRRELADNYARWLSEIDGPMPPHEPTWARSNFQSYAVLLPDRCDRDPTMQAMLDEGVATRPGVMCAHRQPAYSRTTGSGEPWRCVGSTGGCDCAEGDCQRLRHGTRVEDRSIHLPLYHDLTEARQRHVVSTLRRACR